MEIFLCGDIMTGRGIDQILRQPSLPRIHESYIKDAHDYVVLAERKNGKIPRPVSEKYIWGDALEVWKARKPDLKIANLETTITTSEAFAPEKGVNYRMNPDNAAVFAPAQFDIFALANNHIFDWNYKGFRDTLKALEQLHIRYAGAGENLKQAREPAVFTLPSGERVLFFSMCVETSGVPKDWAAKTNGAGVFLLRDLSDGTVQELQGIIESCRNPNDIVIASIHWGGNWGYRISIEHQQFAHALIDQVGVDIVHGHSSHHPRPLEIYQGRPIFYGCGDFINDYEGITGYEVFRDDLVLMYFVNFSTAPFQFEKLELVCLQMHQFRLRLATDEDVHWMSDTLNAECRGFNLRFKPDKNGTITVTLVDSQPSPLPEKRL